MKEDISYFFNILEKSDISLLGYSFKEERIKDEIISKIPFVEIKEISLSFSFKSYLRDEKLNHLFENNNLPNTNVKWFVLDLNEVRASSNDLGTRQNRIKDVIHKIREDMYSGTYPDKPFYKLLILSPMNRSSSDFDINSFIGGSTPIYMSDFVSIIKDGSLEVIKNRFDHVNRKEKISLDKLKDYTYICNYENCQ
jgi:hypothetical protein